MQIFPANNIWNTPVGSLPVHSQSAAWLALVGTAAPLRLDDVMPVNILSGVPGVPLTITDQGDGGLYPIPATVKIELGSDGHALIIDSDTGILYEMFLLSGAPGNWQASSAAKWDLGSNALRKDGDTSADAAGLPITAGLLRYDEVLAGIVNHALRFTAPHTQGNGVYLWPARHYASHNPDGPPMGARVRLKASFNVAPFTPRQQVILNGLKKYGAMLADNGMPWGMQKATDTRWDAAEIAALHSVLGSNMEFVDTSSLMNDPNSGAAGTLPPGIFATDLLGRPNAITLGQGLKIINNALTITNAPATVPSTTPSPFVKADFVTSGSWQGVYGLEGNFVIGAGVPNIPDAGIIFTPGTDSASYTWAINTTDPRGLQKKTGGRIAACWYSTGAFTLNLNFTDGKPHQVALYFLDWDQWQGGRSERVEILDSSGVIDSRQVASFANGTYLVWNLSGHVLIRITNLNPASNAVLSGIFFDPAK